MMANTCMFIVLQICHFKTRGTFRTLIHHGQSFFSFFFFFGCHEACHQGPGFKLYILLENTGYHD